MLERLSDEQLVETFVSEMKRRGYLGLACCIGDERSVFAGSYGKEWSGLGEMSLADQLRHLAAYASLSTEIDHYVVDEIPELKLITGGRHETNA